MENNLGQLISRFYDKLHAWENDIARGINYTPGQLHTIDIVGESRGIKMKDLAEKMGITTGTLTLNIDTLEKKGALERTRNPEDRRSYLIMLTEIGENLFEQHRQHHQQMIEDLLSGISPEEREVMAAMLRKMLGNM